MKNLIIAFLGTIAFLSVESTFAKIQSNASGSKTETFKVYGNCGMCKKKIEGALTDVKGVKKAEWNKTTKMMEVTFNEEQITLNQIKQKIADVGYDTDSHRAKKKVYDKLHGCCQYERPE